MPRYLEVAAEANAVALELMRVIKGPLGEEEYGKVAEMIARLVNFGVRCSPRGVQHSVRFAAVRRAVRGLPVKVSMREVKDERTGRTYNALITEPVGGKPTTEKDEEDARNREEKESQMPSLTDHMNEAAERQAYSEE